jgi:hypothetical protein
VRSRRADLLGADESIHPGFRHDLAKQADERDWQNAIPMLYLGYVEVLANLGLSPEEEPDLKSLGRKYTGALNRWLSDNDMPPVEATSRAAAIKCAPILREINEWRDTIKRTHPKRLRWWRGPQVNLRNHLKSIAPGADDSPEPPPPARLFPKHLDTGEIAALIKVDIGDDDRVREIAELLIAQVGGWDHMVSFRVGCPLPVIRDVLKNEMGLSYTDFKWLGDFD